MIRLLASDDGWITLTIDGVLHRVTSNGELKKYEFATNTWVNTSVNAHIKLEAWARAHPEYTI